MGFGVSCEAGKHGRKRVYGQNDFGAKTCESYQTNHTFFCFTAGNKNRATNTQTDDALYLTSASPAQRVRNRPLFDGTEADDAVGAPEEDDSFSSARQLFAGRKSNPFAGRSTVFLKMRRAGVAANRGVELRPGSPPVGRHTTDDNSRPGNDHATPGEGEATACFVGVADGEATATGVGERAVLSPFLRAVADDARAPAEERGMAAEERRTGRCAPAANAPMAKLERCRSSSW